MENPPQERNVSMSSDEITQRMDPIVPRSAVEVAGTSIFLPLVMNLDEEIRQLTMKIETNELKEEISSDDSAKLKDLSLSSLTESSKLSPIESTHQGSSDSKKSSSSEYSDFNIINYPRGNNSVNSNGWNDSKKSDSTKSNDSRFGMNDSSKLNSIDSKDFGNLISNISKKHESVESNDSRILDSSDSGKIYSNNFIQLEPNDSRKFVLNDSRKSNVIELNDSNKQNSMDLKHDARKLNFIEPNKLSLSQSADPLVTSYTPKVSLISAMKALRMSEVHPVARRSNKQLKFSSIPNPSDEVKETSNSCSNSGKTVNPPEAKSVSEQRNSDPLCTPAKFPQGNEFINKPRVQCSIDVSSYMKTPVNRMPGKLRAVSSVKKSAEDKENTSTSPMMRVLFKMIIVNGVNYVVLKELGKGGSSCVYHVFEPKSKLEYAIKCVDLNQDENAVTGFKNEVKMLFKLQHCDRVIKMHTYQIKKDEKKLYVVLEKGGKDLSSILKDLSATSKRLPMYTLIHYWMEMLYAIKEIHTNGIIHSDLKPANFLEASGKIKLIDFGISSQVQNDSTSVVKNFSLGTFNYISPEALQGDKSSTCNSPNYGKTKFRISYKSDVWSLGCILYQLVYRRTPFQHITHNFAKLTAIMDPNHKIEYPHIDSVPERILNTIKSCLRYDTKSRPSIDDLIAEYEQHYC